VAKATAPNYLETSPESDRFEHTRHPRESYDLFGHTETERKLLQFYISGCLPQAFIIGGPPGIGKATLAWRTARFLLANPDAGAARESADLFVPPEHRVSHQIAAMAHPDIILLRREWNPETKKHYTQIQVEDVRRASRMFQRAAGRGGYRVCIIDCADDLNPSSANALLKLVEEPPLHSLFLIVAHRPSRMLATLRSRCRKIPLRPLGSADIRNVVATFGPPWCETDDAALAAAIAHAQGSIHSVLRSLDKDGIELDANLRRMLEDLPRIDWTMVHALANRLAGRDGSKEYEAALGVIEEWLDAKVRHAARGAHGNCVRQLAPYALVWEKLAEAARETEIFNLDRRPFVLSIFTDLAAAARASCS
jgi:DNA polymerase III subunit delta'